MPLITASHDSLPYIDPAPPPTGPHSLSAARSLITASLPPTHSTIPHPLLPALPASNLTPLALAEQDRIAHSTPLAAISTSRYELPTSSSSSSSTTNPTAQTLREAYTASHYLRHRSQHLELLNRFGKNAWLVGNAQLEDILRGVEREVVDVRGEVEGVNRGRKAAQEAGRGEVEGLEGAWKEGVGRVVEVEVEVGRLEGRRRGILREGGRSL